jgi:hypothetical protein
VGSRDRRAPLLVTGVPRSGTTWLARQLATDPHTCLPGREPMNPRGRQFALGGQLDSWVRRQAFSPAEAAVLRRCYQGREPRAMSRYGKRQWAALLPRTRIVVKDPFALLSVGAVHRLTGAVPVVVYRNAAAVLASYRRMHWSPDTRELVALGAPEPVDDSDLAAMAAMWSWCHETVLSDLRDIPAAVVVSHQELTVGGATAWQALGRHLGLDLRLTSADGTQLPSTAPSAPATGSDHPDDGLHNFDRSSSDVESGWRRRLDPAEISRMEDMVSGAWRRLEDSRLPLPAAHSGIRGEGG